MGNELGVSGNYVGMLEAGREIDEDSSLYKLFVRMEAEEAARARYVSGPRAALKIAREAAGLSQAELAKRIKRPIGYVQALEEGSARISEETAKYLVRTLPNLDSETLLAGSDLPPIVGSAAERTVGSRPDILLPEGMEARYVPLISWTQAGTMASFDDEAYQYEGHIAFDVQDNRAIALRVRGDSMMPQINENDVVILYPSFEPRNGEVVVARLADEYGGDVMCKVFHQTRDLVKLTSYNPAHPPLEYSRKDFRWIYPVASVVKHFRR